MDFVLALTSIVRWMREREGETVEVADSPDPLGPARVAESVSAMPAGGDEPPRRRELETD